MDKGFEQHCTYPQGEEVLVIWFGGGPSWVLSRLVGWDEMHEVKRRIQQAKARLVGVCRRDLGQDFRIPFSLCILNDSLQVGSMWNFILHIVARFLG